VAFISAVLGVVFLVLGGALTGAAPVLANYIPVVDHPVFLLGLGLFFFGVIAHTLRTLGESTFQRAGGLSPDAGVGVQASGLALVLAASSWVSAQAGLPEGLDRHTHFEFAHWGAGHVLQVANVAAMLAIWLWLAARATGRPVLSARRARWLFGCLLLPHAVMPLLSWQGALHRTYVDGATLLMRWGIFPVVLATLILCLRHRSRQPDRIATEHTRLLWTGLATSAGLTLLGFSARRLHPGIHHTRARPTTMPRWVESPPRSWLRPTC
jgi:cytochrome c oxidase subunit 1